MHDFTMTYVFLLIWRLNDGSPGCCLDLETDCRTAQVGFLILHEMNDPYVLGLE